MQSVASQSAALPNAAACHVHKFGGSSLADAAHFRAVAGLIDDGALTRVVVVSAIQGVTDALLALLATAQSGQDWAPAWSTLRQRHLDAADALDDDAAHGLRAALERDFDELREQLSVIGRTDEATVAGVPALGEVWSSRLMQVALAAHGELVDPHARHERIAHTDWLRLDAREVLVVHPGEMGVAVDWDDSRRRFAAWRLRHPGDAIVVTGYAARDAHGNATTLGRNGSDFSAAIFANLFEARALTIWTDVDGVLSADPRLVPDAVCLPSLSYAEACELAYFGAKVLHPQTLAPVSQ